MFRRDDLLNNKQLMQIFELKLIELTRSFSSANMQKKKFQLIATKIEDLRQIISIHISRNEYSDVQSLVNDIQTSKCKDLLPKNNQALDIPLFIANILENINHITVSKKSNMITFFQPKDKLLEVIEIFSQTMNRMLKYPIATSTLSESAEIFLVQKKYSKAADAYRQLVTNDDKNNHNKLLAAMCDIFDQLQTFSNAAQISVKSIQQLESSYLDLCSSFSQHYNHQFYEGLLQKVHGRLKEIKSNCLLSAIRSEFPSKNGINASYLLVRMIIRELYGPGHFKNKIDNILNINQDQKSVVKLEAGLKELLNDVQVKNLFTQKLLSTIGKILEDDSRRRMLGAEQTNFSDEDHLSPDDREELQTYLKKLQEITNCKAPNSVHLLNIKPN